MPDQYHHADHAQAESLKRQVLSGARFRRGE